MSTVTRIEHKVTLEAATFADLCNAMHEYGDKPIRYVYVSNDHYEPPTKWTAILTWYESPDFPSDPYFVKSEPPIKREPPRPGGDPRP